MVDDKEEDETALEAEETLERASKRNLKIQELFYGRHNVAFFKGDKPGMKRVLAESQVSPEAEALTTSREAFALAYAGQLKLAKAAFQRAMDIAMRSGHRERAAEWEAGAALAEAFYGNGEAARQGAAAALRLSKGREVKYAAGLALAIAGDSTLPRALSNELEESFTEDTSVQFSYLPTLRAQLLLNRGDWVKAIDALIPAAPLERGTPRISASMGIGAMYPVYVRGAAYLNAQQYAAAAAEFQKILDEFGIVLSDPVGAVARLQLGRALDKAGKPRAPS